MKRDHKMGAMRTKPSALERVLRPNNGDLSPAVAQYLLSLDFSPADHLRYEQLSLKAQDGKLREAEQRELEDLLTANDVLMILHSKARASRKRRQPAA